jgi:tRNA (guanine-N7-)-methyltransferase
MLDFAWKDLQGKFIFRSEVAKKKLSRFAETLELKNVIHAGVDDVFNKKHALSGRWAVEFFGSDKPVVLELGCGKGEYTVGLARMFPSQNFLGVDIKGSRIWKGARFANENNMKNAGFLRARIDFISSFFARGEIDRIWITFPDPQPGKPRKRLTSSMFLNRYRLFLREGGSVHLKTDSRELYDYTLTLIRQNNLEIVVATNDLYNSPIVDEVLSIKTYYEQQYLDQGKPIAFIEFRIDGSEKIEEPV